MNLNRIRVALGLLDPELVKHLLGRTVLAQKTRALILHDNVLTRHPRSRSKP